MDYMVLVHKAEEGGYWTEVPALPGCFSQGESVEDALTNTKDAIECHLIGLREDGEPIAAGDDILIGHVRIAA